MPYTPSHTVRASDTRPNLSVAFFAFDMPSRTVRHRPGGIPPQVRRHPDGDLTDEMINEEAKGWLLFVAVNDSV